MGRLSFKREKSVRFSAVEKVDGWLRKQSERVEADHGAEDEDDPELLAAIQASLKDIEDKNNEAKGNEIKTKFDDLPSAALAVIASHATSTPLNEIQEVRMCNCYNFKTIPFRSGVAHQDFDTYTRSEVRQDSRPCRFDRGQLGPWCLKENLINHPGQKRQIPTFAVISKMVYKKWRDSTVFVFCGESCLAAAVKKLPPDNIRVMTRVRLFEQSDKGVLTTESKEGFSTLLTGNDHVLVYKSKGLEQIEYHGSMVFVKEMELSGMDIRLRSKGATANASQIPRKKVRIRCGTEVYSCTVPIEQSETADM